MMNYPIMETPFILLPFEEMKKKQVEQYFQWYMTEKANRIRQLSEFINQETNKVLLDNSAESLIDLWEWFESHIEYQEKTERELHDELSGKPLWIQEILKNNTKRLTLLTMALAEDIAIYFSETMIKNHSEIRWGYRMRPKKLNGVNQPILLGFHGDISVNPRRLVSVCISKSTDEKNKYQLYETYKKWEESILIPN